MDDLISRAALRDAVSSVSIPWYFVDAINAIAAINTLIDVIDESPTVDAIPVEWIRNIKDNLPQSIEKMGLDAVLILWAQEQEERHE